MLVIAPQLDGNTNRELTLLKVKYGNLKIVAMDIYLTLQKTPLYDLLYNFGFWRAGLFWKRFDNVVILYIE